MAKARVPILMWGEIVLGGRPVTRRTLVGPRAHECMYAWVYLTDYYAIKRFSENLGKIKTVLQSGISPIDALDEKVWDILERTKIDPHFQLKKDNFRIATSLFALLNAYRGKSEHVTCVELGQTFFTLMDKLDIVGAITSNPLKKQFTNWIGIDNSEFANRTALTLHSDKSNISIFDSWNKFEKLSQHAHIFTSRFVSTYAFKSTDQYADFLCAFDAIIIEDAFNTKDEDSHVYNHGQAQTFFNLKLLQDKLRSQGYEVSLIDFYGDAPSGSGRCIVAKILAYKPELFEMTIANEILGTHGFSSFKDRSENKENILTYVMSEISEEEWRAIEKNKSINPVWSKTDKRVYSYKEKLKELVRPLWNKWRVRKTGLHRHDLRGRNMEESLVDYLNQKP